MASDSLVAKITCALIKHFIPEQERIALYQIYAIDKNSVRARVEYLATGVSTFGCYAFGFHLQGDWYVALHDLEQPDANLGEASATRFDHWVVFPIEEELLTSRVDGLQAMGVEIDLGLDNLSTTQSA